MMIMLILRQVDVNQDLTRRSSGTHGRPPLHRRHQFGGVLSFGAFTFGSGGRASAPGPI
jgi:hypothetical protein